MVSEQSAMWWVAHVILESAQGPNPFFSFFLRTSIQLGGLLGQGLGLGPGLDNCPLILIHLSSEWVEVSC